MNKQKYHLGLPKIFKKTSGARNKSTKTLTRPQNAPPNFIKKILISTTRAIKEEILAFSKKLVSARLTMQEQALFARRLSLLSKAGVPLLESINILKKQTKGSSRKMFDQITNDLANGQFLSKSLMRYRNVFGDFAINIIRVGETSGMLSDNLKYLSEEIDKKRELRGKVLGALIYPAILVVAALAISGFLTLYLFPKLMPVFQSLNVTLPIPTRILMWISVFLTHYGTWLILVMIFGVILFAFGLRSKRFKFFIHRSLLRIPITGDIIQYYHLTNICRTLGLLLKGQVRVLEAVNVTAESATNLPYRKELEDLKTAVTRGSNIASHLEKNPGLFPFMLTDMIAIGEKTGNLSDTLIYLAGIYEQELNEKTKQLSSVIEPVMMLVMGLIIGFIAISIITPIYEVTQHLTPR